MRPTSFRGALAVLVLLCFGCDDSVKRKVRTITAYEYRDKPCRPQPTSGYESWLRRHSCTITLDEQGDTVEVVTGEQLDSRRRYYRGQERRIDSVVTTVNNKMTDVQRYFWSGDGRDVRIETYDSDGALQGVTEHRYDGDHRVVKTIERDSERRLIRHSTWMYDTADTPVLTMEVRSHWSRPVPASNTAKVLWYDTLRTETRLDSEGRILHEVLRAGDSVELMTRYTYDAAGILIRIDSETNADGEAKKTTTHLDAGRRPVKGEIQGTSSRALAFGAGIARTRARFVMEYNANGDLVRLTSEALSQYSDHEPCAERSEVHIEYTWY